MSSKGFHQSHQTGIEIFKVQVIDKFHHARCSAFVERGLYHFYLGQQIVCPLELPLVHASQGLKHALQVVQVQGRLISEGEKMEETFHFCLEGIDSMRDDIAYELPIETHDISTEGVCLEPFPQGF